MDCNFEYDQRGLTEKVTFQLSPKEGAMEASGRALQAEGTASAKALRRECAWGVSEAAESVV